MAFSLVLAALLLAAGASQSAKVPERIVGGENAPIDNYPSLVAVESRGVWTGVWAQNCAGTVLTTRWIVSAAHCFEGVFYTPSARRVRAGSSVRNTGGQQVVALREFNHPGYGSLQYDCDISVVLLDGTLDLSTPVVSAATLVNQGFRLPDNYPVVHAGWGHTQSGGSSSQFLQSVTIFTINRELCAERYLNHYLRPYFVTDNMVCAGILDVGGKDACQGDSGGPLYFYDDTNTQFLYGVVSWGYRCAEPYYPGVSTTIGTFTDWIIQTVNNN